MVQVPGGGNRIDRPAVQSDFKKQIILARTGSKTATQPVLAAGRPFLNPPGLNPPGLNPPGPWEGRIAKVKNSQV